MNNTEFDVLVVGAGPGGYPAALKAAQLGKRVAIVEREHVGGVCLNSGCVPTKTLLASAECALKVRDAAVFGVDAALGRVDYAAMLARKNAVTQKLRNGILGLLKKAGVTLVQGTARLEDATRVSVAGQWFSARHIILATGSSPLVPAFLPRHPRVMDSTAFLNSLDALPRRLAILGGGVIGCEFACMAAALGAKVTLVEKLNDILPMIDADLRRVLKKHLASLGVTIHTGAALEDIAATDAEVTGRVGDEKISADILLVSIGRKTNLDGLGLENAGLAPNAQGRIETDAWGRTPVPSIFAVGDINAASPQLAHFATAQATVAVEKIAGRRVTPETLCPACIFTFPEIATVGLTEEQARTRGRDVRVSKFPFLALGKALAINETDGFVKWVADAGSGQLLGAHVVGPHATELIATAALAIRNELTAAEAARTIHAHPTLSEAWMEAAQEI
ncbi:MAG: dihydrolipoyl dehydrogenase [Kiritimatiellaeota bacterium]|nr:dihydrolipoyl dehydrogenase [Kiritimatiellota bacterium]